MEILATNELTVQFWVKMTSITLLELFLLFMLIISVIEIVKKPEIPVALLMTVFYTLTALNGYGLHYHYSNGVTVQHKVKITDFNEVYKNGYEIIGQEGEIYTIQKKR